MGKREMESWGEKQEKRNREIRRSGDGEIG